MDSGLDAAGPNGCGRDRRIYVLLEIDAVWHGVSWVKVGALAVNVGIGAYLSWALWPRRGGPSVDDGPTPHLYRSAQTLPDGHGSPKSLASESI
jgi:hypothetical protein